MLNISRETFNKITKGLIEEGKIFTSDNNFFKIKKDFFTDRIIEREKMINNYIDARPEQIFTPSMICKSLNINYHTLFGHLINLVFNKKIIKVKNGLYKSIYHENYVTEEIKNKHYTHEEKITHFLSKNSNRSHHKNIIMKHTGIKATSLAVLLCNLKKDGKIIHSNVGCYRIAK